VAQVLYAGVICKRKVQCVKIVIPTIITPLIYLAIALTLVHIPIEKNGPGRSSGLDFDVLDKGSFSAEIAEEHHYKT
jgi:hypothetical protein